MNIDKLSFTLMCVAQWAACAWNLANGWNLYGSLCLALGGLACGLMARGERGTR